MDVGLGVGMYVGINVREGVGKGYKGAGRATTFGMGGRATGWWAL